MYISFSMDSDFASEIQLPIEKRLLLEKGIEALVRSNQELLFLNDSALVDYLIFNDAAQEIPTLEATLALPIDEVDLVKALVAPVTTSSEAEEKDVKLFLKQFNRALPKRYRINGKETESSLDEEPAEFLPSEEPPSELHEKLKRPREKRSKLSVVIPLTLLVLLGFVTGGYFVIKHFASAEAKAGTYVSTTEATTSDEPVDKQIAKAIETEDPVKVGDQFPEQLALIANLLTQNQRFDDLEKFNERHPTPEGTFDLAFHNEDWKQVITLNDPQLTPERQAMLVYAYVQLGQMEEAEILNKTLKSDKLTEEIQRGWKVAAIKAIQKADFKEAERIQKKISDSDVKELIDVGKTCQEMIELYSKKKDNENKKIWQDRLAGLGKEFLDSGE
ncbi:hypothetical protein [Candidatus Enterococcus leclercqii]|uniref:hypothetical protein n=1 Tax=Candidatus Enterococcus leclercqii TaxID=1857218 RepID=UPI001379C0AC|nr:hypothetical protein [Enterococcus sp. CU9D]KAF1294157.1 hypothetical protein BAU14_07150 [Enterococcus sp. CU9D]